MTVRQMLLEPGKGLSFEVFPPKESASMERTQAAAEQMASLRPRFVSVTYGAGGRGSRFTLELAGALQQGTGVPVLAHMTCVNAQKETVLSQAASLRERGIENIMALRGDLPEGMEPSQVSPYHHAADLIRELRWAWPQVCIGGACYPETHPESPSPREDILRLKEKTEAGCDFLTTQMFFSNPLYWRFLERLRSAGVTAPVIPGIMPITSKNQLDRVVRLSGAWLPPALLALAERYGDRPEDMFRAGVDYAVEQMRGLYAQGTAHIHLYTMNKPAVASAVWEGVGDCLSAPA